MILIWLLVLWTLFCNGLSVYLLMEMMHSNFSTHSISMFSLSIIASILTFVSWIVLFKLNR